MSSTARAVGESKNVGLPPRPFLYTLDQVAGLVNLDLTEFKKKYCYYENRSTGVKRKFLVSARNIAAPDDRPDWRISERELIRWMRYMGFKYYDRGYLE